ncbi:MAG: Hpt domain-containing protein [Puniceicoccales bacterium]
MSEKYTSQEASFFNLDPSLPILDQEQVELLVEAADGDMDFLRDIVDTFNTEAVPKLKEIETCAATRDADELRKAIHFMAGSAANTGLLRLSELCRRIETQVDEGVFEHFEVVPELVRFEHERAMTAVEQKLSEGQ